jgi:hypothetical protein
VGRAKKSLRGRDKIALAVGAVIDRYKMAKRFVLTITDDDLTSSTPRHSPTCANVHWPPM